MNGAFSFLFFFGLRFVLVRMFMCVTKEYRIMDVEDETRYSRYLACHCCCCCCLMRNVDAADWCDPCSFFAQKASLALLD